MASTTCLTTSSLSSKQKSKPSQQLLLFRFGVSLPILLFLVFFTKFEQIRSETETTSKPTNATAGGETSSQSSQTQSKIDTSASYHRALSNESSSVVDKLNLDWRSVCDITANCTGPNQICMNGRCGCKPNFDYQGGECRASNCDDDAHACTRQDPNRFCNSFLRYGSCYCAPNYFEDQTTRICRRKCVSSSSSSSSPTSEEEDSQSCENIDSLGSLCNVYRCQCSAGFRRNSSTGHCEPFRCERDAQCWTEGDWYRTCDTNNGTCICAYEIDPLTQRCMIKFTSLFKIHYYYTWRTERILLATIFIVPIVLYYCLSQNYRKAKSTIVSLRGPGSAGGARPTDVDTFGRAQFCVQNGTQGAIVSIQTPKLMAPPSDGATGGDRSYWQSNIIDAGEADRKATNFPKNMYSIVGSKNIKYERFS